MTTLTVARRDAGIHSLTVKDHADFVQEGPDIVCAAASVLITTCINALEKVAGFKPLTVQDEKKTQIACMLPSGLSPQAMHDAQIILQTTLQGFRDIASEYPKHLKIIDGRKSSC